MKISVFSVMLPACLAAGMVPYGGEAIMSNDTIQQMIAGKTRLRPKADPALGTGSRTGVEQCPVGALAIHEGLPEVGANICIICFCCQEMCPAKAIRLQ